MSDIGLNENIAAGSREFHVQTATLVDDGLIRAEVFEKGRLLFVENYQYEKRSLHGENGAEKRLRREVDQFHQSVIEEIDSLFEMSERVFAQDLLTSHEKIGQVFLHMHIFDRAENHFRRAIELDRERYSSYVYLARCAFRQKRYKQAADILGKLIEKKINYPDLYNLMGLVMLEKSNLRLALHYFREAIKRNNSYIEAYFNLAEAILKRISVVTSTHNGVDTRRGSDFLKIILKRIESSGDAEDRKQAGILSKVLARGELQKARSLVHEYRESKFVGRMPAEIIGYRFYLRLVYSDEELSSEQLELYEDQLSYAVQKKPGYPDLWHYLALIHLMQCRHYFLTGLDNFRDAHRINPSFDKAMKNLRLVENDGREFLSLIKTIM